MKSFMSICLKKNSKTPIYRQLGGALLELIEGGVLKPHTKLPPIRKMAKCLKINSSTVVSAYKYLENKNAVYGAHGSGVYVSSKKNVNINNLIAPLSESSILVDFSVHMTKASYNSYCINPLLDALRRKYSDNSMLKNGDEIKLSATSRVFNAIAQALVGKNDCVLLEKPVNNAVVSVYLEQGAKIFQIPVMPDGLNVELLKSLIVKHKPSVLHISPYFQQPTGVCYSIENKRRIYALCKRFNVFIVEEDNYSEILSEGESVHFKHIDDNERTIYVKNLTKAVMPELTAYCCIMPKKAAQKVHNSACFFINGNDMIVFNKLHEQFYSISGNINTMNIVNYYSNAYKNIAHKIKYYIGEFVEFDEKNIGAFVWITLKSGSATAVAKYAAERGVLVIPGDIFFGCDDDSNFLIAVTMLEEKHINYGFSVLRDAVRKQNVASSAFALDTPP